MSQISYGCVSRGSIILAHYFLTSGDFDQQCLEVREKMQSTENIKIVEKPSSRVFIQKDPTNDLFFMCAGTPSLDSKQALAFLDNLQKKFLMQYSRESKTANAFAMQQEFSDQIKDMIHQSNSNKLQVIKDNIGDAQNNLNEALQQALIRGGTLESMNEKADTMALNAHEYERSASRVRRKMCWEKYKWYLFTLIIIILLILILVVTFCGFDLSDCKSSNEETSTNQTSIISFVNNY